MFQNERFNASQIPHYVRSSIAHHAVLNLPPPDYETSNAVKRALCEEGDHLFEGHAISRSLVFRIDTGFSVPLEVQHEKNERFRAVKYQLVGP